MRYLMGLVLAGGLLLGTASNSDAQVAVSIGNPYLGQGLYVGSGYGYPGYGLGYPVYGGLPGYGLGYTNTYTSVYGAGLGGFAYSSGYRGVVGPGYGYGYGARPYIGGYGYGRPYVGGYGYGYRGGYGRFGGCR